MFQVEARKCEGYVELICRGPANLKNFKETLDEVAKGTFEADGDKRYLIDLRPIEGTLQTVERFELGAYMGENLRGIWIAAISKRETHNKVGENVAVNRGANVFSTDDENQAKAWILQQTF